MVLQTRPLVLKHTHICKKKFLGNLGFIYSPMYNVIRVGGFNELLQSIYLRNLVYNFPYISYSNLRVL